MTEEEAKTKWCPMVVFMLGGGQVRNRDACYDVAGTHCIGSSCMMWRETGRVRLFEPINGPHEVVQGYCGLAGKT